MNPFARDHLVSMVTAPIVWAVHFVVSYVLVATVCARGWTELRVAGWDPAEIGVAFVSIAGLVLIGYTAALNLRKYRGRPEGDAQSGFFALTALLLCALSAVALLWVAFPVLLLPTCAW